MDTSGKCHDCKGEMLMGIGDKILDHYAKYLGDFVGSEQYRFGDRIVQILGFPNVFKDCMVFATFGMTKFSEEIHRLCEVVLPVDDLYDECSEILANTVCHIVAEKMEFGRGILIEGVDNIVPGFSDSCGKSALYFTDVSGLPEEFSVVDGGCEMYMCFFVTKEEAEFFKQHGSDAFETYLEENEIDVAAVRR